MTGLIAAGKNFALDGELTFLPFTAASGFLELAARLIGFNFLSKKPALFSGQSHVGFDPFSYYRWIPTLPNYSWVTL